MYLIFASQGWQSTVLNSEKLCRASSLSCGHLSFGHLLCTCTFFKVGVRVLKTGSKIKILCSNYTVPVRVLIIECKILYNTIFDASDARFDKLCLFSDVQTEKFGNPTQLKLQHMFNICLDFHMFNIHVC
jgi:hypothetical protein